MIGQIVLDKDGVPLSNGGKSLEQSKYIPPTEVMKLFARVQRDYQTAWNLQHKPLDEFDGYSLLQRAKLDQETFAAFVGIQYEAAHKRWRWKGRKNAARNKLIGILAHLLAGMLFPFVYAQNEKDEEDKTTARVMRILIEEKLKKAGYELKFFYSVLCALVNPAVFVEVEYVMEMTNIRQRMKDGTMTVKQVVDELVSGLLLHLIPIDEILPGDYYSGTGDFQALPFYFRERRIPYDKARGMFEGKHFYEEKDLFDYVRAGHTKVMTGTNETQTLFDVESDDADANYVQLLTVKYRKEDLELTWVGGVGMFDHVKPYDNPIKHRRMAMDEETGEFYSIPLYNVAMSGFEPIDPAGRFLWFKSGAFKEYWEDKKITELDRLLIDGIKLDVIKPMFLSGVAKIDQSAMAPGATVAMPQGANAIPYQLGPNLVAAHNAITQASQDMAESTQDKVMQGITEKGITATQTVEAKQNARIFLGVFGFMIANLVKQIGELAMDCTIQHETVGNLDQLSDGSFSMKYRTVLAKGKEKGKNVTNRIIFTDEFMGRKYTKKQIEDKEWALYEKSGGEKSDQRIWMINPYRFARTRYSMYVDADQIVMHSMGADRLEKDRAFEKMMDPRVMPFIDPEAVVTDFILEEYSDGDPDRYKRKEGQEEMIEAMLGQATPTGARTPQSQTLPA
jgi:hypothetical protein